MHSHRTGPWAYGVSRALIAWLWAVSASAQGAPSPSIEVPAEAARVDSEYERIVSEALAKYGAKDYEAARALFERAHALEPSARTFRALGMVEMALDSFGLAQQQLRAALRDERKPLEDAQRHQVTELLDWMRENLAVVRLRYTPAQAHAEIDQRPVSVGDVLLEPGVHDLQVSAPGFAPQTRRFQLVLTKLPLDLQIDLEKQPSEPALDHLRAGANTQTPSNVWLWVGAPSLLATLTGAGFLTVGLLAISNAEQPEAADHISRFYERADRGRLYTALGLGIGAAGLLGIAWATFLKVQDSGKEPVQSFQISPTQIAFIRRF